MDNKEINSDLTVIFKSELSNHTINYDFNNEGEMEKTVTDFKRNEIEKNTDNYIFKSVNVNFIIAIWQKIKNDISKQKCFISNIKSNSVKYYMGLGFFGLIKCELKGKAINLLREDIEFSKSYCNSLRDICNLFKYEHFLLSNEQIEKIKEILEDIKNNKLEHAPGYANQYMNNAYHQIKGILELILQVQHYRLGQKLLPDFNPEINKDKEKVKEKLVEFSFSNELNKAFDEIDKCFRTSASDFDFKSTIGLVRSFHEILNKELMLKIKEKSGVEFCGDIDKAGDVRNYFKKNDVDFLKEKECELDRSIYGLASDEGVHSLSSKMEYVRICKNIVIELALLYLERVEKYLDNK